MNVWARSGRVLAVDVWFELVDEPVEGVLAFAVKVAVVGVVKTVGGILHQPLVVGARIALNGRHDHRGVGVVQIIGHPPALAIGGVTVKKHVLAVEHIEHRIPAVRVCLIHGGQIYISAPLLLAVDGRVAHSPLFDHRSKIPLVPSISCSEISLAP